jgi:hypothetical protein
MWRVLMPEFVVAPLANDEDGDSSKLRQLAVGDADLADATVVTTVRGILLLLGSS